LEDGYASLFVSQFASQNKAWAVGLAKKSEKVQ
jgi:hypothetical protein